MRWHGIPIPTPTLTLHYSYPTLLLLFLYSYLTLLLPKYTPTPSLLLPIPFLFSNSTPTLLLLLPYSQLLLVTTTLIPSSVSASHPFARAVHMLRIFLAFNLQWMAENLKFADRRRRTARALLRWSAFFESPISKDPQKPLSFDSQQSELRARASAPAAAAAEKWQRCDLHVCTGRGTCPKI